jgi:hydrogenase maturation protein HypF
MRLAVQGTVQGVGFRPFVHREATRLAVTGWIRNAHGAVEIEAQGSNSSLDSFLEAVLRAPLPARVATVEVLELPDRRGATSFEILESRPVGDVLPSLPPDLAPCADCARELADPKGRRYRHPFIACARCGPRFSMVRAMPYDRAGTTMSSFAPCADCDREYRDPADRRFHAEAIACPRCGPSLELLDAKGRARERRERALEQAARLVADGAILAMRGVGGFQLVVDATNDAAVRRLRGRKHRDAKPFAVLVASVAVAEAYARVGAAEARLLESPEAPIVLLDRRLDARPAVAEAVAPNNPQLGCMLPSSPLHRLLADAVGHPVVCTSGNASGEPLCVDNDEALSRLGGIADAFLVHDRAIARPLDDSVTRVGASNVEVLRRARGYAPRAVASVESRRTILALGAHLKASVSLVKGGELVLGQHLGDLEHLRAVEAFERAVRDLGSFYEATPEIVACDLHPDYASSSVARALAEKYGAHLVTVQHHHAHVAAVMAEHGVEDPVLGIAWDGTGLGSDETIWGSEFLLVDGGTFRRFAHLAPYRLPGGDHAARHPWRSAIGVLASVDRDLVERAGRAWLSERELAVVLDAMDRGVNAPITTSMGRLFDAVAAMTGFSSSSTFEGEAAMGLEFAARTVPLDDERAYPLPIREGERLTGDLAPLVHAVSADVAAGASREVVAARFHAALVAFAVEIASRAGRENVVLGGGCFQNRLLASAVRSRLEARGHRVFGAGQIPCNDGGISAGQAFVAARIEPV